MERLSPTALSNEILLLKRNIQNAKQMIIKQLTRTCKKMKESINSDKKKLKNTIIQKKEAKLKKILLYILELKKFDLYEVAKLILLYDYSTKLPKKNSPTETVLAKIAKNNLVQDQISQFRSKYPMWEVHIPSIYHLWTYKKKMKQETGIRGRQVTTEEPKVTKTQTKRHMRSGAKQLTDPEMEFGESEEESRVCDEAKGMTAESKEQPPDNGPKGGKRQPTGTGLKGSQSQPTDKGPKGSQSQPTDKGPKGRKSQPTLKELEATLGGQNQIVDKRVGEVVIKKLNLENFKEGDNIVIERPEDDDTGSEFESETDSDSLQDPLSDEASSTSLDHENQHSDVRPNTRKHPTAVSGSQFSNRMTNQSSRHTRLGSDSDVSGPEDSSWGAEPSSKPFDHGTRKQPARYATRQHPSNDSESRFRKSNYHRAKGNQPLNRRMRRQLEMESKSGSKDHPGPTAQGKPQLHPSWEAKKQQKSGISTFLGKKVVFSTDD